MKLTTNDYVTRHQQEKSVGSVQKAKVNVIRQINTTINKQKNLILTVTVLQCLKRPLLFEHF